jgi:hypothetical protein
MSAPPPPYPRIPHLVGGRGTKDDLVLAPELLALLLREPMLVEEKVDGANVVLWMDGDTIEVALRAGPGAMDRAGQLGPLRAWAASSYDALRKVLVDGTALYAEWLLLTHSSSYDRLPSYLVALDLWRPESGFLTVAERDSVCASAGLITPPPVWTGVPGSIASVERLLGPSAWGPAAAEGLLIRCLADPGLRAKLVPAGFRRLDDDEWRRGRPRNRLVPEGASWR